MNRILDFTPSPEDAIVERILVSVHKAVDQHFPEAQQPERQFTKTVFSDENTESTAIMRAPISGEKQIDREQSPEGNAPSSDPKHPSYFSQLNPMNAQAEASQESNALTPPEKTEADWVVRITLAFLMAGIVILTYLILSYL